MVCVVSVYQEGSTFSACHHSSYRNSYTGKDCVYTALFSFGGKKGDFKRGKRREEIEEEREGRLYGERGQRRWTSRW